MGRAVTSKATTEKAPHPEEEHGAVKLLRLLSARSV